MSQWKILVCVVAGLFLLGVGYYIGRTVPPLTYGVQINATNGVTASFADGDISITRLEDGSVFARCPAGFRVREVGEQREQGERHPRMRADCAPNPPPRS